MIYYGQDMTVVDTFLDTFPDTFTARCGLISTNTGTHFWVPVLAIEDQSRVPYNGTLL